MPYKVEGKKVLHKVGDKWTVKQNCSSHENAIKAVAILHMKGFGKNK